MCCDKIHIVLFHSQIFVSYSEYVKVYFKKIQISFMFKDFLGSDPEPENLTGSGSDQRFGSGQIRILNTAFHNWHRYGTVNSCSSGKDNFLFMKNSKAGQFCSGSIFLNHNKYLEELHHPDYTWIQLSCLTGRRVSSAPFRFYLIRFLDKQQLQWKERLPIVGEKTLTEYNYNVSN